MQTDYSPYDTATREEVDVDRKERQRLDAVNEINDFQWLMSGPRGRRIVQRLLAKTGVFRSSFDNSGSVTAFREGERNVGLRLMALIEANCPDEYILMLQERMK